jgi:hypothetical protein
VTPGSLPPLGMWGRGPPGFACQGPSCYDAGANHLKWPAVESLGAKGLERNDPLVGRAPSAQFNNSIELIRLSEWEHSPGQRQAVARHEARAKPKPRGQAELGCSPARRESGRGSPRRKIKGGCRSRAQSARYIRPRLAMLIAGGAPRETLPTPHGALLASRKP